MRGSRPSSGEGWCGDSYRSPSSRIPGLDPGIRACRARRQVRSMRFPVLWERKAWLLGPVVARPEREIPHRVRGRGRGRAQRGSPCVCCPAHARIHRLASAVVLVWSRSSPSARSGHTPAVAGGLEASLVTRASLVWAGWLVWARSGIPSRSAARTAALVPVARARRTTARPPAARGRRSRTESAERARRNMVAH